MISLSGGSTDYSEGRGVILSGSKEGEIVIVNTVNVSRDSNANSANVNITNISRDPNPGLCSSNSPADQLGMSSFPSSALLFSSGCLSLEQDNELEERGAAVYCIDQVGQLFAGFKENPPTLEEALQSMGYRSWKELSRKFMRKGEEKLKEFDAPGLTAKDVATIICYSFEWNKKRFWSAESPYRMLNESLCVNRNNTAIKRTRAFMFLLLRALRKLPRSISENHVLYRGIDLHVQTEANPEFPKRLPYAPGNEKTWWTFTSTTMDLNTARNFIKGTNGTLAVLTGETWGYDIRMFSDYPKEKEILLEPERKLMVEKVSRDGGLIIVDAKILDTPLVLEGIVPVAASVNIKAKMSNIKIVPKNFRAGDVTGKSVELSWDPVVVEGKKVVYQVYQMTATTLGVTVDKNIYMGLRRPG